jgi:hypothetical protein
MKLGFIERTSHVIGNLMIGFILLFLSFSMLIFIGMGLMKAFSIWLNSEVAGSFATAGIFLILILLFVGLRKKVLIAFAGFFIGIMTAGADDDDDDDEKQDEEEDDEDDETD